jgi:imidazole glycerol-phosphate synthase subunit HisF
MKGIGLMPPAPKGGILIMATKMHGSAIKLLFQRARELREQATHAEEILWGYLRTKPLGFKFRRQHPFTIYILDFYCHKLKLVIEVDGSIHSLAEVKSNDDQRQLSLENAGMTILRFSNHEVENSLEEVIKKLEEDIKTKKTNE